ncbi:uncharacterized protein E0L32_009887 [Thyridium curvatum]|uniref:Endo-polygalacturonase n=1 Tax=Thyridium curvatum TaxID=1093900 RepID=A0A507AV30_9PEZI|nr:uncharacterized protein E0L32_009887 [Thyridium curvatum]TPX08698.1 hypothetical protein E0L32_009887 [Thyridium curvatum]
MKATILALLYAAGAANAATISRDDATPLVFKRGSTCTPKAGGSESIDDVPAIQAAIASCPSGTIVIPSGTIYHINSVFSFAGCAGCTLQVEGTLKVTGDTDYWQGRKAIFLLDKIAGATVVSTTGSGLIDGSGQAAWDRFARDKTYRRPTLFYVSGSRDVVVDNMRLINAPNVFHSARDGSANVRYTRNTLSAVSSSGNPPKNTDGWDIGAASHVAVERSSVVNDDDCVALKPGADYVTVTDITCTGSHGISVGSLGGGAGKTDSVTNVYVSGATMVDSTKAAGIKLYPGGSAHGTSVVRNVTFENFDVQNTEYAFQIQSCYGEDQSYCDANPSTAQLSQVMAKGFRGATAKKYAPTVANINCPAAGSCGVSLSDFTVKPPSGTAKYLCSNTPSNLGVACSGSASG